jgi:uncharacterized Zn-finger protein
MSDYSVSTDINLRTDIDQLIERRAESPPSMADHPWAEINSSPHLHVGQFLLSPSEFEARTSRKSSISTGISSTPQELECNVEGCTVIFKGEYRKGNLARHRRLKHVDNNRIYLCEGGCGKKFNRQDARLKHYRRQHPHLVWKPREPL